MKKSFKERVGLCFRSNDVRCVADRELDEEIAYKTARAAVLLLKSKKFVVGRDMRVSSKSLSQAFIRGLVEGGANVVDIGMADTPSVYFASVLLKCPGGIITASHNPAEYNGIKLIRKNAEPIGERTGLKKIREFVERENFSKTGKKGKVVRKDVSKEYRKYVLGFINSKGLKKFKVVIDAGNGMAGKIVPIVYKGLPIKIIKQDFKIDGTFPMHVANPSKAKNIKDLLERVKKEKADFGIAFDADMDRVFFVDEKGTPINGSVIAALLIKYFLQKNRRGSIVYNPICSRIVPETIRQYGGRAFVEKVGHSFMKEKMAKTNSLFGCEHTAHYYYKKNYYADSGIITSLFLCEIFSGKGSRFSELVREFQKYYQAEERSLEFSRERIEKVMKFVESYYKKLKPRTSRFDGLTMDFGEWWFNVRPSNTESLLRINLEANSEKLMKEEFQKLLGIIKKGS